jgi:hypothetical protein
VPWSQKTPDPFGRHNRYNRERKKPAGRRTTSGLLATPTGLEPATTGSTVRYSNQLSYGAVEARRARDNAGFAGPYGQTANVPRRLIRGCAGRPRKEKYSRPAGAGQAAAGGVGRAEIEATRRHTRQFEVAAGAVIGFSSACGGNCVFIRSTSSAKSFLPCRMANVASDWMFFTVGLEPRRPPNFGERRR